MSSDLIQSGLFTVFSVITILPFIPIRWSLLAYFAIAHIGFTREGVGAPAAVGFENAVRLILLPTVLLFRTRLIGIWPLFRHRAFIMWVLFVTYVGLGALWSPFPVSALKQLGYFYAYTTTVIIAIWLFKKKNEMVYPLIANSILIGIGIGILATYFLESRTIRFASFTSAQGYAISIPLFAALLIIANGKFNTNKSRIKTFIIFSLMLVSLYLNGGRTALLALLLIIISVAVWPLITRQRKGVIIVYLAINILFFVGVLGVLLLPARTVLNTLSSNRALQAFLPIIDQNYKFSDINTAVIRLDIYEVVGNELKQRSWQELFWGSGTSSAGEIITNGYINYRGYNAETVDPNRVIHNEFLRAMYEWGIFGEFLWLGVIYCVGVKLLKIVRNVKTIANFILLPSFFIIFTFLLIENILSSSGSPGGIAISILIGYLFSEQPQVPEIK